MLDKEKMWSLVGDAMRAFSPFYQEAMREAIRDSGAPDSWFGLSLARGSDPDPFTVERLCEMSPYAAPARGIELLEDLRQRELLEKVGENAYRLTDRGRGAVEAIYGVAHQGIATVEPLPTEDMDRLNGLLRRLVEATLEAPEPEEKWAIAYSRWTDPGEDAPASVRTDQYLTDLLRYRDDAHIAAWKPYDVSGHAWEALTFVWRGEAGTAEELAEQLPYRGYTAQDYGEALQGLAVRGWVVEKAGAYELTEQGKGVRERAEEDTDRYCFIGWDALSEEELATLEDLLARAKESLHMTALQRLWGLAGEVSRAIPAATQDVVNPLFSQQGFEEPGFVYLSVRDAEPDPAMAARVSFFALFRAHGFEPDPVSAARLGLCDRYTDPAQYANLLAALAEAGFLTAKGEGEYELTEKARTAVHNLNHAFYTRLGEIPALPAEELAQLEELLGRLAEAMRDAPEPADKWCISGVHRRHPRQDYGLLAQVDQHLDEVHAFRDDAHLGAWKPYDVSGRVWEALSFVWSGEARTAEELVEQRPYRGHSLEDWTEALAELAGRGWVEETPEGYEVTGEGRALRQEAEEATDRYYYAPWACLSEAEQAQLRVLLTRLRDNLQQQTE